MKTWMKHCLIGTGVIVAGIWLVAQMVKIIDRMAWNPIMICVPLIFLFLLLGAMCME